MINKNSLFKIVFILSCILAVGSGYAVFAADSRNFQVKADYCDGSSLEIYPYSRVTKTDSSVFNCYNVQVTPISSGYRYGFEDQTDNDYNDVIIELWVTGNNTGSPVAHVKFISKEATFKHWIYVVIDGAEQLVFKAEESAPGTVYDIPLPVKGCPDFYLNASPSERTIYPGDSTDYNVTVNASNGFSSPVSLKVDGLPAGVTGSFDPNPLPVTGESKLNIVTSDSAAPGTYSLTITGTSADLVRTVKVTLIIKAKPVDFSLNATPSERTIYPGENTDYTVSINPVNGFSSPVSLKVDGLPAGVTAGFDPNPLPVTGESKLNIVTSDSAAPGTYSLTITGTGADLVRTAKVTLIIKAKPADFSLNATPSERTIYPGENTDYTVSINPVNGFSSPVSLKVDGLPSGVTAGFDINPLPVTAESRLSIATTSAAAEGTYSLTITGTGADLVRTVKVTLIIKIKPVEKDYELNASPSKRTIYAGENTFYTVTVKAINGFSSPVSLKVEGLPTSVTASFNPNPLPVTAESKFQVVTNADAPAGTYTLTIIGQAGDIRRKAKVILEIESKPVDGDFKITAEPAERMVRLGGTATYTVKITALNEFNKDVSLTVSNLPAGTEATFSKTTVKPGSETELKLKTSAVTPLENYSITITGKGGDKEHETVITLKVVCPDFSIRINAQPTAGPAPLAVQFHPEIIIPGLPSYTTYTYIYNSQFKTDWDFGDNSMTNEPEPLHTYTSPGSYTVRLTVTDPCSDSKSITASILVEGLKGTITKSFSVSEAAPGDEVSMSITLKNETQYDLSNISVKDELSPYFEYISDTSGTTVNRSGQKIEWQFAQISKGASLSFIVKIKIADTASAGVITNIAYLHHAALGNSAPIASNTASLTIRTVEAKANKQVDKSTAKLSEVLTYRLTLEGDPGKDLTGVVLSDELPEHLRFVSASPVPGGDLVFSKENNTLYWKGTVKKGDKVTVEFTAHVKKETFSGTIIENAAELTADQLKAKIVTNRVATTVASEPIIITQVRFTKRAEVPQAEVGRIIRFSLTISNISGGTLLSPVIEDNLPQGFQYVAGSTLLDNAAFTDPQGKRRLMWVLPHINAGQNMVIRYQVVIGSDAARGKNVNVAQLRAVDNTGKQITLEASDFVNVSASSFIFYSSIEGVVYIDRNNDDFYSMQDTPLSAIEVRMSTGERAITDNVGHYSFENLFPGEYAVSINKATLPEKYRPAVPGPKVVVLSDGLSDTVDFAIQFANEPQEADARLQGRVFFDKNQNKIFDEGEPLLESFEAQLDQTSTTKGNKGEFVFTNLKPGSHTVKIIYENGTRTKTQEIKLKEGRNQVDFPLHFTGIKIIIKGEK